MKSNICPSLSLKGESSDNESQMVRYAIRVKSISHYTELPALPYAEGIV